MRPSIVLKLQINHKRKFLSTGAQCVPLPLGDGGIEHGQDAMAEGRLTVCRAAQAQCGDSVCISPVTHKLCAAVVGTGSSDPYITA